MRATQPVIAGFGDSYCAPGEKKTAFGLAGESVRAALADANIVKTEIDGLLTGRGPLSDPRPQWNNVLAAYLKITPQYSSEITTHAAGMLGMVRHAAAAIESGLAGTVLCVGADAAAGLTDPRSGVAQVDLDPEFELPYEPIIPTMYALQARRFMHEYGMTEEDMAHVSVQSQNWAIHHPYAFKRKKGVVTVEDVLASPMISSPLRLWNCAPWGPAGTGGAVIVTTLARAVELGAAAIPILGSGECQTHEYLTDRMALVESSISLGTLPNLTHTGCRTAADAAYRSASLGPDDVGLIQTASNFSHMVLSALSELGFTRMEDAGAFVRSGVTDVGGSLPTNTNGGWLSFGQAGVSCVMDSLIETIRQLRRQALGYQVPDTKVGLVHAAGGTSACHTVLLLGAPE